MALSKSEQILAEQSANLVSADLVLQKLLNLIDFGEFSISLGVSVIVGGSRISGSLISPRQFGRRLDMGLRTGTENSLAKFEEDGNEYKIAKSWIDRMAGIFETDAKTAFEEEDEHRRALEDLMKEKGLEDIRELKLEDLPDDLALADIAQTAVRPALTLEHAVIAGPPSWAEHEIGTVRIQTSQIEAWWLNGVPDSEPPDPGAAT